MPSYRVLPGFTTDVQAGRNANWYRTDHIKETLDRIVAMELSTVEGRREAAAVLATTHTRQGRNLWGMTVEEGDNHRFPNTWDDTYLTDFDPDTAMQITQLRTSLTIQRETNIAKDSQTGRAAAGNGAAIGPTAEGASQSQQDVRKAIVSLITSLQLACVNKARFYDRRRFEREFGVEWGTWPED